MKIWLGTIIVLSLSPLASAQTQPAPQAPPPPAVMAQSTASPTVNTPMAPLTVLTQIVEDVRKSYNKLERPIVIFDIDGTLFDNRPRILQILKEYANDELKGVRPEAVQAIGTLTIERVSYQLPDTLASVGVTEPAIVNNAAVFWSQRFFSDDYLKYDVPTKGAVNFARTLYSNGARIVYLTARDAPRQLLGTVKSLRDNGFPIGIQSTELIMRPTVQTQDAIFKQQVTNYLRQYGKVVATFDNEPGNANVYRRAFADATVLLYSAQRAPNPPPLLPNIMGLASFE